ncbi:MAG: prefoldin subunit alpha [Nanoarchaeota archaeon]
MTKEEKLMQYSSLNQQIQHVQQQLEVVGQQAAELQQIEENIEGLNSIKEESDAYLNIGAGILIKAKVKSMKNVYMTVGANILTVKSLDEAKDVISNQVKELQRLTTHLQGIIIKNLKEIESLKAEP